MSGPWPHHSERDGCGVEGDTVPRTRNLPRSQPPHLNGRRRVWIAFIKSGVVLRASRGRRRRASTERFIIASSANLAMSTSSRGWTFFRGRAAGFGNNGTGWWYSDISFGDVDRDCTFLTVIEAGGAFFAFDPTSCCVALVLVRCQELGRFGGAIEMWQGSGLPGEHLAYNRAALRIWPRWCRACHSYFGNRRAEYLLLQQCFSRRWDLLRWVPRRFSGSKLRILFWHNGVVGVDGPACSGCDVSNRRSKRKRDWADPLFSDLHRCRRPPPPARTSPGTPAHSGGCGLVWGSPGGRARLRGRSRSEPSTWGRVKAVYRGQSTSSRAPALRREPWAGSSLARMPPGGEALARRATSPVCRAARSGSSEACQHRPRNGPPCGARCLHPRQRRPPGGSHGLPQRRRTRGPGWSAVLDPQEEGIDIDLHASLPEQPLGLVIVHQSGATPELRLGPVVFREISRRLRDRLSSLPSTTSNPTSRRDTPYGDGQQRRGPGTDGLDRCVHTAHALPRVGGAPLWGSGLPVLLARRRRASGRDGCVSCSSRDSNAASPASSLTPLPARAVWTSRPAFTALAVLGGGAALVTAVVLRTRVDLLGDGAVHLQMLARAAGGDTPAQANAQLTYWLLGRLARSFRPCASSGSRRSPVGSPGWPTGPVAV